MDLDNTFVIRDKGANYVNEELRGIVQRLMAQQRVVFLPNTGRDIIGFKAFCRDVIRTDNAILGSGSLVICDNKHFFNDRSAMEQLVQASLFNDLKQNLIQFVDFYDVNGRSIYTNDEGEKYKDLFFTQNPREWFGADLPPVYNIKNYNPKYFEKLFRVEFPVFKEIKEHLPLFLRLSGRMDNNLEELNQILQIGDKSILENYSAKRKTFFSDIYSKEKVIFCRLEKTDKFTNKGKGLKKWLELSNNAEEQCIIFHFGDRDTGLINDTLVKQDVPSVSLIMVGNNCALDNPEVGLYLGGDIEQEILLFFTELSKLL